MLAVPADTPVTIPDDEPIAATDALLFGMPAILTDSIAFCSYPEVARASHVFIVPPHVEAIAQAMARAIQGLEQLQLHADGEFPKLRARFSWEAIARIHLLQYSAILSQRTGISNRPEP